MATSAAVLVTRETLFDADRHGILGLVLSASLPLAVFVILNGFAHLNGVQPLFFAPFGLPAWAGCALYLGGLPLFGAARWMTVGRGQDGRVAGWWLVGLMAGVIVFPFIVAPLDSLALSMVAMALLVVGLAAGVRTAKVSRKAALLMLPGLLWMGFSAFVGLSFVASWSPPFGPTNSSHSL